MKRSIAVIGFGPGVSQAVAEAFGAAGFALGLVARSDDRTASSAAAFNAKGVAAASFKADAGNPDEIRAAIRQIRDLLGPVGVVFWNAFSGREAGDILVTDPQVTAQVFNVAVIGLLSAVQEALPDLKAAGDGAVLITNGAMADLNPMIDQWVIGTGAAGVALANAAKTKLTGLLAARLKAEGVFVGEVMIAGAVKGTPTGDDVAIDPAEIAASFLDLYRSRDAVRARVTAQKPPL